MQVQWRPTTKYLDDAQVGYEKDYDDARAGSSVGFASERDFLLVGFLPTEATWYLVLCP